MPSFEKTENRLRYLAVMDDNTNSPARIALAVMDKYYHKAKEERLFHTLATLQVLLRQELAELSDVSRSAGDYEDLIEVFDMVSRAFVSSRGV